MWRAVVSHPFNRDKHGRKLGDLNPEMGEPWTDQVFQLGRGNFNLSAHEANRLFVNESHGKYYDVTHVSAAGLTYDSRSVAVIDYNNDGRLDLVVRSVGGQPLVLLENRISNGNYLRLKLRKRKANRFALGARVIAHLPSRQIVQQLFPANSYLSQGVTDLHFGLGAEEAISRLEVHWPGGGHEVLNDLPANRTFYLTEGEQPQLDLASESQ